MSTHAFAGAILVVALGVACKGRDEVKGLNADSSIGMSPTASGDTTAMGAPASPTPAPTLSDENVLALLDGANASDSAAGSIAASKGTSPDVKDYGRMMVRDHHALRQEGQAVAKRIAVTPQPPPNDSSDARARAWQDSLRTIDRGATWDRIYISHEVATHEQVLDFAQKALGDSRRAEITDLIRKVIPSLEAHLSRARAVQSKLGGSPS